MTPSPSLTAASSAAAATSAAPASFATTTAHFGAGFVALSTAFAVMHPVDTLKARVQAHGAAAAVFSRESLRVLGRGFFASVAGAGPQGGLRLATYEHVRSQILARPATSRRSSDSDSGTINTTIASAVAAVAGDLASSIVKPSARAVAKAIVRTHGPQGLFRGFFSTAARDVPFMVILFATYDVLRQQLMGPIRVPNGTGSAPEAPAVVSPLIAPLAGGAAGAMAGVATAPLDVIKTRVMAAPLHAPAPTVWAAARAVRNAALAGTTVTRTAVATAATARAFFAGAAPRGIWWFGVCAIFFPTYEATKRAIVGGMEPAAAHSMGGVRAPLPTTIAQPSATTRGDWLSV
ncbi:hypothetical protein HK405_003302 [Cladochytrium tenue]|nr:hypothetical protein HK405_003302 [Cladochytrium tenue]